MAEEPKKKQTERPGFPEKLRFFDAARTNAYLNVNLASNFLEFRVATQVDKEGLQWRIMKYEIHGLGSDHTVFKSEDVMKKTVPFSEALYQLAAFEEYARGMDAYKPFELTPEKYPLEKFAYLKPHFFDVEYYRIVANIEGIAFDRDGHPHGRVKGKIITEEKTVFDGDEISKSILSVDQVRANEKAVRRMEAGILSDIFSAASDGNAGLEEILKIGKVLAALDNFASYMGAFYLGVQQQTGTDDKFDKIWSLPAEDKKDVLRRAQSHLPGFSRPLIMTDYMDILLPEAAEYLKIAEKLGVHVEPFQKHLAECELYGHLLHASINLKRLQAAFRMAGRHETGLAAHIRDSVEKAKKKFISLGGTNEEAVRLEAWVTNPNKAPIPDWMPRFLSRYYATRSTIMQRVEERQAGVRQVNTMSATVKPPFPEPK